MKTGCFCQLFIYFYICARLFCSCRKKKKGGGGISVCVYLRHALMSLFSLVHGGCVHGFIGDQIGALYVINGFDFRNGGQVSVIQDLVVYFCLQRQMCKRTGDYYTRKPQNNIMKHNKVAEGHFLHRWCDPVSQVCLNQVWNKYSQTTTLQATKGNHTRGFQIK